MTRPELAAQLFCQGYNCAQAVAVAFCDVTGLTQAQAAKMASQRPCARMVLLAASILEEYIQNHPLADNK